MRGRTPLPRSRRGRLRARERRGRGHHEPAGGRRRHRHGREGVRGVVRASAPGRSRADSCTVSPLVAPAPGILYDVEPANYDMSPLTT